VLNHSYESEFRLQVHFHADQTYFHKKRFARRLVLKRRHKVTRKWPILHVVIDVVAKSWEEGVCAPTLIKYVFTFGGTKL